MKVAERRAFYRNGLSSLYLPFYDALCARLGPEWQPYSGLRTFDQQIALYAKGRTSPPIGIQHRVTNATAGQSAHNYGCATDWTWFDGEDLKWLEKEDPRWQVYISTVTGVGLRPGAEFGDVDHNEIRLACDWPHVLIAYNQGGMTAAQQKIEVSIDPGCSNSAV